MNILSHVYNLVKDSSWPKIENEHEFRQLPLDIQEKFTRLNSETNKFWLELSDNDIEIYPQGKGWEPWLSRTDTSLKKFAVASDFEVHYCDLVDGGGLWYSQLYPRMIRKLYADHKFENCLEWCSGAGFIGFRLMSDGIVNSITMMDVFQPALEYCKQTWEQRPSRLQSKAMNLICEDQIQNIGDTKFDLIVANPPNFDIDPFQGKHPNIIRITQDPGYKIHTEFFLNIKKNLAPDGKILFCKHVAGSQPSDHEQAISNGGLKLNRVIRVNQYIAYYFLEVVHQP